MRIDEHDIGIDQVVGQATPRSAQTTYLVDPRRISDLGRTPFTAEHGRGRWRKQLHQAVSIHAVDTEVVDVADPPEAGGGEGQYKIPHETHALTVQPVRTGKGPDKQTEAN